MGESQMRINAEPAQVVQLAGDTREISYPVCIAIEKTTWVNLINHTRLPPGVRVHHALFYLLSQVVFVLYLAFGRGCKIK